MSQNFAGWKKSLQANWQQRAIAPLQAMSERDRVALLLAGLTLVGAVDWFVVWPMNIQRGSIVQAAIAQAQATADAAAQAQAEVAKAMAALDERSRNLDADLAKLGMAQSSGQQLGALLTRALQQQAVQVLGLRETAAESIEAASPAAAGTGAAIDGAAHSPAAAATSTPSAATGETAAAAPVAALFRHRFELRLQGEVPALLTALSSLERQVKPLRIARVRLEGAEGKQARLTLGLVVLSTERVWLSL